MTTSLITLALDSDTSRELLLDSPGVRTLNEISLGNSPWAFAVPSSEANQDVFTNASQARSIKANQARELMGSQGFITVIVLLDKDRFFDSIITSASDTDDPRTPEDYAHEVAFDFGLSHDSSAEIIGVSGHCFIVSYTTRIGTYLAE
jgi:hypothetical protein